MNSASVTFQNVRLLNPGRAPIDLATVTVEAGKIASVTSTSEGALPTGLIVDSRGLTLMPGLIDAHIHILGIADYNFANWALEDSMLHAVRAVADMGKLVDAGFTTVRDAGSDVSLALKRGQAQGSVRGPRVWASGRWISVTGNLPDILDLPLCCMHGRGFGVHVDGVAECQKAVREQVRAGADVIKIGTTGGIDPTFSVAESAMSNDELAAVVDTAHGLYRKVTAHNNVLLGQRPIGLLRAVKAGVDAIDHGYYLSDEAIEAMAAAGTWWIITSSYLKIVADRGPAAGLSQIYVDKAQAALDAVFDSIPRARAAGVKIAIGSDLLGTPLDPHGLNAMELGLMRDAGFTDTEVIELATAANAKMLGIDGWTGSIETGKAADLILVSGQPDRDIMLLTDPQNVRYVMVGGVTMKDAANGRPRTTH